MLALLRKIAGIVLAVALAAAGAYAAAQWVTNALAKQERSVDEKLAVFQEQVAALNEKVEKLTGANSQIALSVQELQNRKAVREKSQDELLTDAVAKVAPSVVSIAVSKDVPQLSIEYINPFGNDPFFKDFNFRIPVYRQRGTERQKVGAGTGFLISQDGYILTNRHVVSDTTATYTALLSDGTKKEGTIVFRDPEQDVALMKIDGGVFRAAPLGNSDALKLGQTVIAIGNALGEYSNSVSVGIISGQDRELEARDGTHLVRLTGVLQTDAAINPGNSGGPLINLAGEVVGINVATVIGGNSISFSIPINIAKVIVENLIGR